NEIRAHAFACDVLSEHSVKQLIGQSLDALGGADLLINVAGKGYVRALGMMRVSRAFAAAAAGRPVTIANIAAATSNLQQFGYAGSKPAFRRLSDGLGGKLRAGGVTVITADELQDKGAVEAFIARLCQSAQTLSPVVRSASR
ncbi:MAG: SDR family NAD(P)-dependent oxidoreductase, partial [Sphingomicrobium sp.]